MRRAPRRAGVTLLEIQVAMVVLGIALAGLCSLMLMQMKLLRRIESQPMSTSQVIQGLRMDGDSPARQNGVMPDQPVLVLQPQSDGWVRRLGIAATFNAHADAPSFPAVLSESTLDDADSLLGGALVLTPNWTLNSGGTYHELAPGNTSDSATWTFDTIGTGRYRVMISWPLPGAIPSDVNFTLTEGSSPPAVYVVPASGANQIGAGPWYDLGDYSLASSLKLELVGSVVGKVAADAVRIGARNVVTVQPVSASDPAPADGGAVIRVNVGGRP